MPEEDPFFVVRDEVVTALTKSRSMYERWCELHTDASGYTKEEVDWTTTELRNGLRSIEWDLEDLEETIGIVESNPKKFKLDESEIGCRKRFITATREEVAQMRDQVVADTGKTTGQNKKTTVASLMNSGLNSVAAATGNNGTKYSKLSNEIDSPSHVMSSANHGGSELNVDLGQHQSLMLRREDDSFDRLKNNVGTLKSITSSIHREREEHAVMLDEVGGEVQVTTSRADYAIKKVARVLGLSTDRKQWAAVGFSSIFLLAIIAFFII